MTRTGGRKIREAASFEPLMSGYPDVPPGTGQPQQGEFIAVGPAGRMFFGLVNFSPLPDPRGRTVLNAELGRYITSQLTDGQDFLEGSPIYFNPTTRLFVAPTAIGQSAWRARTRGSGLRARRADQLHQRLLHPRQAAGGDREAA